ncbi:cytochrome P450 family protein [Salinispora arenicola]|uniref:Cytochrome P450 n=1 Tax=Salinispora arenicola TaxID=168697 RepID=A0A542XTH2_SALAC|nr:cytochrome P450 [Salinispora arenicola]MCN0152052.1 cytochrome P450 [Salinispora arenicola]TQL39139.1 cytochrome P450 [Salinispora arenicola]GIM88043.1 cytochrome P450 [Salinispora arenicola]
MEKCPYVLDRAGSDIHKEASNLRARGPVTLVELHGGYTAWSVTSYEVAKQLLMDPRISKNTKAHWPEFRDGNVPQDWELYTWVAMDNMQTRDGKEHDRLRKLVAPAFTGRQAVKSRPIIEEIVNRLLDDLETAPRGQAVDIKARYFYPLSTILVCDLLGIAEEDRDVILHGNVVNSKTTNTAEESEANLHQWQTALGRLVETKRRDPGDDLTTVIIKAGEDEQTPLTDDEVIGSLHLLIGGGTETTANVLCHTVVDMLTHPDQLAMVRSGAVSWESAWEEEVRKDGAVGSMPFRCATDDVEIGGVTIAKGDLVLINYAAAGRDPERYGDAAAEFDITRADKANLSFGYGRHRCLGPALATMEAMVALPALFDRFPNLALAVPPNELKPQGTFIFNGYAEVPLLLRS